MSNNLTDAELKALAEKVLFLAIPGLAPMAHAITKEIERRLAAEVAGQKIQMVMSWDDPESFYLWDWLNRGTVMSQVEAQLIYDLLLAGKPSSLLARIIRAAESERLDVVRALRVLL